ncbi:MAG: peptidyl-prolyl cis-trans isomerase [Kofleriaceae bacterium]
MLIARALLLPCFVALLGCQADRLGTVDQARDKARLGTPVGGPGLPGQSASELSTPLATVDGLVITLGDFQAQLNQQSPYVRARYASLEQKKEFLDTLIKFEVLAKEAQRRGFDQDPEVVRSMKQVMIQKLLKDEFERKLTPDSITDAELQAYYDANLAEYVKPAEVRASAIIVKTKAQAQRIATEAQGEAGRTNKAFRDLVSKYSTDDETKLRGGDLRYFAIDTTEVPKAVAEAAFALAQVGDVSGPIDAGDGRWFVVKQTGKRKASTKTLDEAKAMIRNKLYRDKRIAAQGAFVAGLRASATITVDEASLGKVRIDTSTAGAPAADPHGHLGMPPELTGAPPVIPPGAVPEPEPETP